MSRRSILTVLLCFVTFGALAAAVADAPAGFSVTRPPRALVNQWRLPSFYQKFVSVNGFPVLSSERVDDRALLEAAYLIDKMIGHRPDVLRTMALHKTRFTIMAPGELTTAVPEHSDLKPRWFWDRRARGLGATDQRPCVSCGEENLLRYPGDPYAAENILIHEFAHAIHQMGLAHLDATFNPRLDAAYHAAMAGGLWKNKYAANNKEEYWAEAVQSWFDTNRENDPDHNHVNTRAELKEYDPAVAKLVEEVFGDGEWRYTRPETRMDEPHLRGYDAARAPRFAWPLELQSRYDEWQKEYFAQGEGKYRWFEKWLREAAKEEKF